METIKKIPQRRRLETLLQDSRLPVLKTIVDALRSHLSTQSGITPQMALTLLCLRYHSTSPTPSAIADYINSPRQTMTSVVDALERNGYAIRRADLSDRRSKTIELTPTGAAVTDKIGAGLLEFERKIWSVFSTEELKTIDGFSQRLSKQIALVKKSEQANPGKL